MKKGKEKKTKLYSENFEETGLINIVLYNEK